MDYVPPAFNYHRLDGGQAHSNPESTRYSNSSQYYFSNSDRHSSTVILRLGSGHIDDISFAVDVYTG
jgi:hypothetical protein